MSQKLSVLPREERKRLTAAAYQPEICPDDRIREMIREQLTPQRADVVFLLAATGLRQGELRSLTVECWNPVDQVLKVPPGWRERTKKHARTLPLGPEGCKVLDRSCTGVYSEYPIFRRKGDMPLSPSEINTWLRRWGVRPHDLRRWFRTTLLDLGHPEAYTKILMGHTLSKVDQAYVGKYTPEKARPWMEKVEALLTG